MVSVYGGGMRILFISDVHLGYDVRLNSELVKKIVSQVQPDLVLSAGDWDLDVELISSGFSHDDFMGMFNGVPVYSILGNHDNESGEAVSFIDSLHNSDGSRVFFDDLVEFGGLKVLGKSVVFNSNTIGNFMRWVIDNRSVKPDALVLHDCPFGDVDLLKFIGRVLGPRLILCGHVHDRSFQHVEYNVFVEYGDSLCFNAFRKRTIDVFKVITTFPFGGYAVIDYNTDSRVVNGFRVGNGFSVSG